MSRRWLRKSGRGEVPNEFATKAQSDPPRPHPPLPEMAYKGRKFPQIPGMPPEELRPFILRLSVVILHRMPREIRDEIYSFLWDDDKVDKVNIAMTLRYLKKPDDPLSYFVPHIVRRRWVGHATAIETLQWLCEKTTRLKLQYDRVATPIDAAILRSFLSGDVLKLGVTVAQFQLQRLNIHINPICSFLPGRPQTRLTKEWLVELMTAQLVDLSKANMNPKARVHFRIDLSSTYVNQSQEGITETKEVLRRVQPAIESLEKNGGGMGVDVTLKQYFESGANSDSRTLKVDFGMLEMEGVVWENWVLGNAVYQRRQGSGRQWQAHQAEAEHDTKRQPSNTNTDFDLTTKGMDPGTAVGVVSLGLQVCEGLLKYYRAWEGYQGDIEETNKVIVNLEKTFTVLAGTLQKQSQTTLTANVEDCLTACRDGVTRLEKKLKRVHKETPSGFKQKAQAIGLRSIYPFRKSTLEKLKEIVQELMQHLDLASQLILLDDSSGTRETTASVKMTVDGIDSLIKKLHTTSLATQQHVTATATNIETILTSEETKALNEILRWLAAPDRSANHEQALSQHKPGTGKWFLNSVEYNTWFSGSDPLLWLHGKAGCCKTVLTSTIIENVSNQLKRLPDAILAYFYFSFTDSEKQTYNGMLLSMVTELSRNRTVRPTLKAAYDQKQPQKPSSSSLEGILIDLLKTHQHQYLLVDALDECSEEERGQVMQGLQRLTQTLPNMRLLMASRKESDIEDFMLQWCGTRVAVDEARVNEDIDMFVKNALRTDIKLMRLPAATKKEIEEMFHLKSDGMFRWAALQLDAIRNLKILRPTYISAALHEMPRTLDETYERILNSIDDLYVQEARTALIWIAFSLQPLTLEQLAEACSIRLGETNSSQFENAGPEALTGLLSVLSSLVVVEYPKYNASRHPLKSGLFDPPPLASQYGITKQEADQFLSQSCCTYILHFAQEENIKNWIIMDRGYELTLAAYAGSPRTMSNINLFSQYTQRAYPLLHYACPNWYNHQSLAEDDKPSERPLQNKVPEDGQVRVSSPCSQLRLLSWYGGTNALSWAAFCGLRQTVHSLCDLHTAHNMNNVDDIFSTALRAAAYCGDEGMVEFLIARGARVSKRAYREQYPADDIAKHNRDRTTEVQWVKCETALLAVICGRECRKPFNRSRLGERERILEFLIQHGADVNCVEESEYKTPLRAAIEVGSYDMVEILIRAGAHIDSSTIVSVASGGLSNYQEVLKLLIKNGATITAWEYYNAVQGIPRRESKWQHWPAREDIAELLVSKDWDVLGKSAVLFTAAAAGYESLTRLLIQAGAKIDEARGPIEQVTAGTSTQGNALMVAARYGHKDILSLLLKSGADPNGSSQEAEGTALSCAIRFGLGRSWEISMDMVRTLIGAGADIHAKNDVALYDPIRTFTGNWSDIPMVRSYLEKGANVNAQILRQDKSKNVDQSTSMLPSAARRGYTERVQPILGYGADDVDDYDGDKLVSQAILSKNPAIVDFAVDLTTNLRTIPAPKMCALLLATTDIPLYKRDKQLMLGFLLDKILRIRRSDDTIWDDILNSSTIEAQMKEYYTIAPKISTHQFKKCIHERCTENSSSAVVGA
ncbi:hypothetical protein P154DRAFT_625367 [Amniculicola lignicola CBS 123094]|uniref:NACHT domain-containing protein n=1 Tax=Amniculicola lignicola CBS 123094 TaxID=1392246 RepID=A0A6A5W079_9PLEO|nr:hypothetical protein P154DRAFT_625367 [Amniculicola lignicola CBS 123094]